jgi:Mrp family chromosome partitioning ATPase
VLEGGKVEGLDLIQAALVKAKAQQVEAAPQPRSGPAGKMNGGPAPAATHGNGAASHVAPKNVARAHAAPVMVRPAEMPAPSAGSVWASLPEAKPDPRHATDGRLVTVARTDPAHVAFDILRTKVLHTMREHSWTSLMITSPTARCGKTVVGLNLAFSLANQKDCRTALLDLDLRRPQVAEVLGVRSPPSMEEFLKGNIGVDGVFSRYGENLAIAPNNRPVRMAAELLQSPEAARAVSSARQRLGADIVVFDLPPMLANDDVMGFLPNVDCAILVVAAEESTMSEIDLCERELSEKTNLLGTVLNKCRYAPEKYGY